MPISRKEFVTAAAVGATLAAAGTATNARAASGLHFHVQTTSEYDRAAMLAVLETKKTNKQVFQSVTPLTIAGAASLYLHMQNSLNAYEFSYGMGGGSLAVLGVLLGPSIVYALDDATWKKYAFGATFNLDATNTYYTAATLKRTASPDDPNGIYQDWSAQAILKRGGAFMVCHNATTAIAALLSSKAGTTPQAALAEFKKHLLPGFQMVPSGVAAVQLAAQHGWHNFPVI
ncbi:MAG: hypothetical protein JO029_00625 [Candidatus Eremiobacteraeota bacterium]|nr:hypothetical protein [Candidatus Eremiobacteraeota bacterium]MBV8432766.1 hypothetical protein [Candidatus Eremiobacteraeota bacterium]